MKRYHYLIAALFLAVAATSCVKEQFESYDGVGLGEDDFAFSIGKLSTKASTSQEVTSQTIKVGETGYSFTETVTNLDEGMTGTKGTPIYTENIDKYYKTINVVGYNGETIVADDTAFDLLANDDNKKIYHHTFAKYFWPEDAGKELYFFLRAPADNISATTLVGESEESSLIYNPTDGTISFDYTSPYVGSEQADILFTSRKLSKNQYFDKTNKYYSTGAPVTFYHALTGVKFRVNSDNDGTTKTIITKVTLKGLKNKGHCVIDPASTAGDYSKDKVTWSSLSASFSTISQIFDNTAYEDMGVKDGEKPIDNTVDLTNSENFAGTSLVTASSDRNLNDADGSLTFWFIPQEITEKVTLDVTFRVKTPDSTEGTEITHTINFGEQLVKSGKNYIWQAGELRTYTLDPKDVDVEIIDTMEGMKKSNLHVANTGNVDEYVRMLIVGNWYGWLSEESRTNGDEPSILIGYATDGAGGESDNEMVPYWDYRDKNKADGSYFDSTFQYGVPANGNKWVRGSGAYYYPTKIGAGEALPSGTDALFQSYEYTGTVPTIYIPSITSNLRTPAVGVHLVMEIVVQAIPATRSDGSEYESIWQAWSETTGTTIEPK